ncbi:hypothetical protein PAXRUDRAFT_827921 [Paxillus rubicundulus Ve08.2h10]|uniref:Uncharacterized protein n=1 Tax=Paxillus rubicundulus Ve08.2h10 TaxID=930991 RepID=A0A0D0DQC1_9AGAM|nr:hypothetical protein PAXRUDRAFT_827921 [Paxillus rubicundulus Ve08.2h10]
MKDLDSGELGGDWSRTSFHRLSRRRQRHAWRVPRWSMYAGLGKVQTEQVTG